MNVHSTNRSTKEVASKILGFILVSSDLNGRCSKNKLEGFSAGGDQFDSACKMLEERGYVTICENEIVVKKGMPRT